MDFDTVQAAAPAQLGATDTVEVVIAGVNQNNSVGMFANGNNIPRLSLEIIVPVTGNRRM